MSQLHIFTSEPHHILASSDVHTFISSHHKSLHLYISTYPPISFYACLIHLHLLSFRHLHIFPSQLHISLYSSSLSGHPSSSCFSMESILQKTNMDMERLPFVYHSSLKTLIFVDSAYFGQQINSLNKHWICIL